MKPSTTTPLNIQSLVSHTSKHHQQIHKHPFNKKKKESQTLDLYLLKHQQMYFVYLALEKRREEIKPIFPQLARAAFQCLFNRSALLKKDIQFMKSNPNKFDDFTTANKDNLLPATKTFTQAISNANPPTWLGFFLVRILADLNGGQFTRIKLDKIYGANPVKQFFLMIATAIKANLHDSPVSSCLNIFLQTMQSSKKGTLALQFPEQVKAKLENILPSLAKDKPTAKQTLTAANQAFSHMGSILTELNNIHSQTITEPKTPSSLCSPSLSLENAALLVIMLLIPMGINMLLQSAIPDSSSSTFSPHYP